MVGFTMQTRELEAARVSAGRQQNARARLCLDGGLAKLVRVSPEYVRSRGVGIGALHDCQPHGSRQMT
jgi:hypothetical protein